MKEEYMELAIKMAVLGKHTDGGGPFGAVIVRDDQIVCKVHNRVGANDDLTQHAELYAIQMACDKIGRANLKDCHLYTSCEPCMMCLGACHWAKFKKIFFGASAEDAYDYGFKYSDSYFDMNIDLRQREFNMNQVLRDKAVAVWKDV